MNNIARLIVYYILMAVLLTVIVTGVYAQYLSSTHIVAGKIFCASRSLVVYSLLKAVTLVTLFMPLVAIIFTIRHTSTATFFVAIIISCVTSFLLLPVTQIIRNRTARVLSNDIGSFDINYNDLIPVSGGYFRKTQHNIYYFIDESAHDHAHVIEVFNDGRARVRYGYRAPTADQTRYPRELYLNVAGDSFYASEAYPFRDTFLKEVLDSQISNLFDFTEIVLFSTQKAFNSGVLAWVAFLSFPLCMLATLSFVAASSWKFINFLSCVVTYIAIFALNSIYYMKSFNNVRGVLTNALGRGIRNIPLHLNIANIDLTLYAINFVLGCAIILVGVIGTRHRIARDI